MTLLNMTLLASFSLLLSAGQVLFKITAKGLPDIGNYQEVFLYFLQSLPFWAALVLYGTATLLWIYILKIVPLSQAYPFVALGFIIVPLAAYFIFHEPIGLQYIAGMLLILTGLGIISLT